MYFLEKLRRAGLYEDFKHELQQVMPVAKNHKTKHIKLKKKVDPEILKMRNVISKMKKEMKQFGLKIGINFSTYFEG